MEHSYKKIGFIGFGNMGSAIAEGLLRSEEPFPAGLYACGGSYNRCMERCNELKGVTACKTAEELLDICELIFICVKPGALESVIAPLYDRLHGKSLISVVWGYSFDRLSELLPEDTELLCTCPNTAVAIGRGVISVEGRHSFSESGFREASGLLSRLGRVLTVDTKAMGIAGTISSCGAAFAAVFIEALADAGVLYGLPRDTAYSLASGMLSGTAEMQELTKKHPGVMKDEVCSPGGATIKGVARLEEKGFRSAVISAIEAIQG